MDLNDFTSAENKKMTTENDIPTFNPPIGDAPKVGVDGKSKKAQTFTPLRHQHGSGMLLPPGREGGKATAHGAARICAAIVAIPLV